MSTIPFNASDLSSLPNLTPMKDLSLFLLKNSLASRMKRGLRSFCNGVASTSTLRQRNSDGSPAADPSCVAAAAASCADGGRVKTLEEMLLQLDLEEAAARRAKLEDYGELNRRMSCVNSADILRSARTALSQHPRFSLDGRDAMYGRSSFRKDFEAGRKSLGYELDVEGSLRMPPTVAGECVVWCKPGVVAKLMGLDVVPVPVPVPVKGRRRRSTKNKVGGRSRNLARAGRCELERERMRLLNDEERAAGRRSVDSCSAGAGMDGWNTGMKLGKGCGGDWELRRAKVVGGEI